MIGILGLQGDVEEHRSYLLSRYSSVRIVKRPRDLEGIKGLILPGGESTAITKLIRSAGLEEPVQSLLREGLPVWGTCAGTILLSRGGIWAMVDADVQRNAYGSQLRSRVSQGSIMGRDISIPMVFIRAPRIVNISKAVAALAAVEEDVVAAAQGNALITTFHPELTPHEPHFLHHFLELVRGNDPALIRADVKPAYA